MICVGGEIKKMGEKLGKGNHEQNIPHEKIFFTKGNKYSKPCVSTGKLS